MDFLLLAGVILCLLLGGTALYGYGISRRLAGTIARARQVEQSLRSLSVAVEQSPLSVVITGLDADIQYVNPQFTRVTGYSAAEVLGQNARLLNSGLTDKAVFEEMWSQLVQGRAWSGEFINRRKSGEIFYEEAHIAPVFDADGKVVQYVSVKLDITERKKAEEHLEHMAHHDALTGLPNRSLFQNLLQQALAMARRTRQPLALMYLDLDDFKPVNDTHGHAVGDLLLKEAAQRICFCLRESDTVGRIGGDEFVVLLPRVDSEDDARRVGEKIREVLHQPFALAGESLVISCSIGIALYPDHGRDELELFFAADLAMYHAKEAGRNRVQIFLEEMRQGKP